MREPLNSKVLGVVSSIMTFIAALNVRPASIGDYYQPKVPKSLK